MKMEYAKGCLCHKQLICNSGSGGHVPAIEFWTATEFAEPEDVADTEK